MLSIIIPVYNADKYLHRCVDKGSRDLKKDICHFDILWNNATVKRGKKYKIPFRTKVLFAIVKTKQHFTKKYLQTRGIILYVEKQ